MINLSSPRCTRFSILLSILLILISVVLGFKYWQTKVELTAANTAIGQNKFRSDVANFGRLFVNDVLKAEGEVDFETRLKLENEVRNLKDEVILKQWNSFISSQDEISAQASVKDLLSSIMTKVCTEK